MPKFLSAEERIAAADAFDKKMLRALGEELRSQIRKESSRLMAEILKILERSYLSHELSVLLQAETDALAEERVLKAWVDGQAGL